jgi:carboxymethylenebutenolidase
MSGDFISIAAAGGDFRAYLAVPEARSGPGLVLLHDVSDDERDLRELGDLYAAEGYVVLCPEGFAVAEGVENVITAVEMLRGRNECTGKVGALGFGVGGKLACLAAADAAVDCAVSY